MTVLVNGCPVCGTGVLSDDQLAIDAAIERLAEAIALSHGQPWEQWHEKTQALFRDRAKVMRDALIGSSP